MVNKSSKPSFNLSKILSILYTEQFKSNKDTRSYSLLAKDI